MNHPVPPSQITRMPIPPTMFDVLRIHFGGCVSMSETVRAHHDRDESVYNPMLPDAVAFTQTIEEVAAVARLCFECEIPLIPYDVDSSLEGYLLAAAGGMSLDLSQMNHVLSVHPEDLAVTVEPGVAYKQLNIEVHDTGLFFPIDPGAGTFIDGMYAMRTSGIDAVRYGTIRENVPNLVVVTTGDRIIRTTNRARELSVGYSLTYLLIDDEGALGITTEITLELYPQPKAVSVTMCTSPNVGDAVSVVIGTIRMGAPIARVEFVDILAIRAVNQYDEPTLPGLPTLFFEFHGSEHGVQEQVEIIRQIAAKHRGQGFKWAIYPKDRSRLWNARHNTYFAFLWLKPGCHVVTTDVCMPVPRLVEYVVEIEKDLLASVLQLPAPIVGHVGDGSFHVTLLIDPNKPEEPEEAERINQRIVTCIIVVDDIYTGEYGVGLYRMDFLIAGHGNDAIDLMRNTRRALDPKHVLSSGKIFHL